MQNQPIKLAKEDVDELIATYKKILQNEKDIQQLKLAGLDVAMQEQINADNKVKTANLLKYLGNVDVTKIKA